MLVWKFLPLLENVGRLLVCGTLSLRSFSWWADTVGNCKTNKQPIPIINVGLQKKPFHNKHDATLYMALNHFIYAHIQSQL